MVLSMLSRHPDSSFTLSEICQRLDINVSTAHSLLNALTGAQFLVRHPGTKRSMRLKESRISLVARRCLQAELGQSGMIGRPRP